MTYMKGYMKTKNIFISVFAPIIIVIVFMIIGISWSNYKYREYFKNLKEIKHEDALNIKVNSFWLNRGVVYFNNRYYINFYTLKNTYKETDFLYEIKTPFYVKKKYKNDTIQIIKSNKIKYLIIDSNRDTIKTIGDMSIPEFYRKYIKKRNK